jgi:hypothetical protein
MLEDATDRLELVDDGTDTAVWPTWAVVDWDALEFRSDAAVRAVPDEAPFVAPDEDDEDDIAARYVAAEADREGATAAPHAEIVESVAAGRTLSLSSERLWDLVKEAAFAAQEARERAARAEGEAEVLRRELDRLRGDRPDGAAAATHASRRPWWRRAT